MLPRRAYNTPVAGFFGRPWDERRPATSTLDLMDYGGGAVPALAWAVFWENRTEPGAQVDLPDLKLDACVPLWPLLRKQIGRTSGRERLPVGLGICSQAPRTA